MHFSDSLAMIRAVLFSKIVLVFAVFLALATAILASGPLAVRCSDPAIVRSVPSGPTSAGRRDSNDVRSQQGHSRFQRRRPAQTIVIPYLVFYYSPYHF